MIPPLNEHGLLPAGVIDCAFADISAALCFNPHRQSLFSGLLRFVDERLLPAGLRYPLFINGSFVRGKPSPSDIDVVLDLSQVALYPGAPERNPAMAAVFALHFQHDDLKRRYHVDFWWHHPDAHPNNLIAFFQYLGDKAAVELQLPTVHPKGILRVQL